MPPAKFKVDASGLGLPVGKRVRKLAAVGDVTVTFMTTATAPVAGTPPWPLTCTFTVAAGPTGPVMPPVPVRVSRIRAGVNGLNRPPGGGAVSVNVQLRVVGPLSPSQPSIATEYFTPAVSGTGPMALARLPPPMSSLESSSVRAFTALPV